MAEPLIQYRYHGRFISAGDASRLSNLKNASAYVSTSIKEGRSHTHISSYASKDTARAVLKDEIAERRAARGLPPLERPAPERPAPRPAPEYYPAEEPEGGFGGVPPSEEFDYEKEGFESPWDDDILFDDGMWADMDWDGDVADVDDDVYVNLNP